VEGVMGMEVVETYTCMVVVGMGMEVVETYTCMVVVGMVMEEVVTCTHKEVVEMEKEVVETCIDTVVEVENCKHKHLLRLNLHCSQQRE
jgi:hypothetical protein